MEENCKPSIEGQRRLNPNMKEVVRVEILKLLDVGIIYQISDSVWISPIPVVSKKGGITVVKNEKNALIPTRTITRWRGYNQIPVIPDDQEKTPFTCFYDTFAYRTMSFGLCNSPTIFQRRMMRYNEANLVLNWEKCHFMVQESIVLGHRISAKGIEMDKAKI
ncbi:uncharacterized protein LOC111379772 [Olea europaea var. sylvestris]|uniref:uncharacterized protein LOC111379772 n=1 Tax=Olea europaea var. sylvestris TaxID=158386 RepID=UPI000C1D2359|nr:uncharacterized protein LOC111379772 [Olea europaea var. sylvestris]